MSTEKEVSMAEHLLSLVEKKDIWDLEIISSILNIDPKALASYVKTLPMAYGLSTSGKRLYVTPELVKDVKDEVKSSFINWYQKTEPDSFSQKQLVSVDSSQDEFKKKILDDQKFRTKITVYGENYLVQEITDRYLSRPGMQPAYQYVGGHEPINFEKNIGNVDYMCQFSVINNNRDIQSLSPLLFEVSSGFIFIFNPFDQLHVEKTKNLTKILTSRRKTDLYVLFLAILTEEENKQNLDEITSTLSKMVEILEDIETIKVSFAILSSPEQIERKINDLVQITRDLAIDS